MSKTLRTLAATALIAASLPQMASAALLNPTITFEQALSAYADPAYGNTTFAGINNATVGTTTSGGRPAGEQTVLTETCIGDAAFCSTAAITIAVGSHFQGDGAGGAVDISFWLQNVSALAYEIRDANGGLLSGGSIGTVPNTAWRQVSLDFGGEAASITFGTNVAARSYFIDDLSFWFDDAQTSVPEPTSVALVALALVGAASVTRRRKR